jgi:hypothetical protein
MKYCRNLLHLLNDEMRKTKIIKKRFNSSIIREENDRKPNAMNSAHKQNRKRIRNIL